MNKKLVITITAIIVLIGGGFAYLATQDTGKDSQESAAPESSANETETNSSNTQSAGRYIDYDQAVLAETEGTKILFFHAPWCPQCRALEASIHASTIPPGVTIFKTDYDSSQALRQKYGVTLQTTLVKIDDQGELIGKFVAYDEPTFESVQENFLQ